MTSSNNVIEMAGLRAAYSLAQRKGSGEWFAVGTVTDLSASQRDRGFWMVTATGRTRESALEAFTEEIHRQAMLPSIR